MAIRAGWTETTLGALVSLRTGKLDVNAGVEEGEFPFFTCSRDTYKIDIAAYSGKSVIVAGNGDLNVKYYEGEFNAYQRTYILQVLAESVLNPVFLFHFMDNYVETLRSDTQGSTIQYLKKAQFTEAPISLPPIAEQRRIVDVVSSVDAYIDALQQHVDTARGARNAVLHELLSIGGNDWAETTLGEVAQWSSGGTPQSGESKYYDGDIPWCVIGDLTEGEVFVTEKQITQEGLQNSSAKIVQPGAVMIAMYGASIGRTGLVAVPMATNQAIACAIPNVELLDNLFLLIYLQTQKTLFVEAGQGAAQPNISQTVLKRWPIPLPSIAEQQRIVEIVSSMDDVIQSAERAVVEAKNLRSGLLSDLLSGEHEIPVSYDELLGAA
jgi:type I restriction enzyme S subunit